VRQNAFPALVARESLEKPVAWILLHVELVATLAVRPYLCDIKWRAASNESQQGGIPSFAVPNIVEIYFALFVRQNAFSALVARESLRNTRCMDIAPHHTYNFEVQWGGMKSTMVPSDANA
jgi:hypothetical protein